ncbi:MAG TPA: glycerophosphodiester phosphodiesterase family protein [Solirubrobacter sp.]
MDLQWLLATPVAHRGLHDLAAGRPENSRAAFAQAVEHGFPIELDVQLSADSQAVVIHDPDLRRLAGLSRRVRQMTAAELTAVVLDGTDQRIPTLKEVLGDVAGRVPLLIDLKSDRGSPVARVVLSELGGYRGRVALQDFNPYSLWVLRRAGCVHAVGQVSGLLHGAPAPVRPVLRSMATNAVTRPDFLNVELASLPNRAVTFWWRRGVRTLAWTANSRADALRAATLADNYLFSGFVP